MQEAELIQLLVDCRGDRGVRHHLVRPAAPQDQSAARKVRRRIRPHGRQRRRARAERNLEEREKRVAQFDIRPLDTAERDRFAGEWREVKALFVDSPQEAVLRGDRLLATMMETRGYPMGDFDRRYEDLTVDHASVAKHYRDGHDIAEKRGEATTEEMRRALNHYEKLYDELVADAVEETSVATDRADGTSAGSQTITAKVSAMPIPTA